MVGVGEGVGMGRGGAGAGMGRLMKFQKTKTPSKKNTAFSTRAFLLEGTKLQEYKRENEPFNCHGWLLVGQLFRIAVCHTVLCLES